MATTTPTPPAEDSLLPARSSTSAAATAAAETTIHNLTSRYPGKVQVHLHPSSSLPSNLTNLLQRSSTSSSSSSSTSSSSSSSFQAGLSVALVWTVESLKLLRRYGVTGSFTGTLAEFPQQNIFLGLPVQLLPEEVVFLLRRGKAIIIDEANSYQSVKDDEMDIIDAEIEQDRKSQQLEAWKERQLLKAKHSCSPSSRMEFTTVTSQNSTTLPPPPPTKQELQVLPWHYTIRTTSKCLPWFQPKTYTTLSSVQKLFPFPSTQDEVASVGLFEHFLSERGLWCMNGLRFGGSFAVYPGDPLRYHSHYTAQLVLPSQHIALTDLVANGRLGTAVKKTHLLCHVDQFHPLLNNFNHKQGFVGKKGQQNEVLDCVKNGSFDFAPMGIKSEADQNIENRNDNNGDDHDDDDDEEEEEEGEQRGKRFATFNIFSLAWAGFGT
ncbi:related to RNA splicing endonuclease gamma subunit [Melanopsichium pennsylvanicum]|uniref:tRNA-intron lyase n=1 Tax=Melanopsichium pennsylvanicum TaxID=63383 RepID=A0AAJ4XGP2_9BASI|nr:related to RNA splicing endonuclease gamma subunit [Melanopsichium pennsylvanicum]